MKKVFVIAICSLAGSSFASRPDPPMIDGGASGGGPAVWISFVGLGLVAWFFYTVYFKK